MLSLPPRRSGPSRQPACDGPCGLRPPVAGSASGASHFRGHLCVPLRYGPVTRLPSRGWRCRWAFGSWFPATRPSKLRGVWLLPRWDCLPLNAPAFAGRTTGHAVCPHTALRSPSATGMRGASPAWPGGLAATGETQERKRGVPASRQSPRRPPHQRQGESAAPSLGGGCVVLPLQTVLWATPTPDTAGRDFGSALYAPVEQAAHRGGSPVVPPGAIPACHPCYPGGPPMPWQP